MLKSIKIDVYANSASYNYFWGYDLPIHNYEYRINPYQDELVMASGMLFKYEDIKAMEDPKTFNEFYNRLLNDIKIFSWKDYYEGEDILDGLGWQVEITFTNGEKFISHGHEKFPYRFWKFVKLCKEYNFKLDMLL